MEFWGLTDCGHVRVQNQDSYTVKRFTASGGGELLAAVVCDGMGGAKAGNVASSMAVEAFVDTLAANLSAYGEAAALLRLAAQNANRAIFGQSISSPEFAGMGTTMVAVVAQAEGATVANVGDSRCYLISEGSIRQITKDHSLVEDMVDRGEIDRAEAWLHPRRNFITRALGTEEDVDCDVFQTPLRPGDALLLCSDGLSGVVSPQELLFEVIYGGERQTAVRRMVDIALERGAPDNVTAVLLSNGTPPEKAQ